MNEFGPTPEETGGENWHEPSNAEAGTEKISDVRSEIKARIEGGEKLTAKLMTEFQDAGIAELDKIQGDRELPSLELWLESSELKFLGGYKADALEELSELADTARAGGYDEFSERVELRIDHFTGLETIRNELTISSIVEACREVLDEEAIAAIQEESDVDEALGLASCMLFESGVDDPDQFLIDKGLYQRSVPVNPDGSSRSEQGIEP